MKHYVYKITNLKPQDKRLYYIGVKSSLNPDNDNYFGSSKYLNEAINEYGIDYFSKEILSTWDTREEANLEEIRLHQFYDVAMNEEYYNRTNATSTGFCRFGMVPVKDTRDGKTKNVSKEEFEKYDYYISVIYDTVSVIDTRDDSKKRVSKEDYKNYDYYVSTQNGLTMAYSKKLEKIITCSINDLRVNEDLVHFGTGYMVVYDTKTKCNRRVTLEEYSENENYVSFTNGMTTAFNKLTSKKEWITVNELKNNDNYVSIHKDKILVQFEYGKCKKISREEFKTGNFKSPLSGLLPVIDTRDGKNKFVSKEEYKKNDFYINHNAKKIDIFDNFNNLQYSCYGSFAAFCKEHNLPGAALGKSFRSNTTVYEFAKSSQITKLKKDDLYKFKGWYARLDS